LTNFEDSPFSIFPLALQSSLWHNKHVMSSRWFRFILVILIGLAAGLLYSLVFNPIKVTEAQPGALRVDYKTDYVLMVAEIYHSDHDLDMAIQRLGALGEASPNNVVTQAILFAEKNGYSASDLSQMRDLSDGLLTWNPSQEAPTP
jgi:hypothetical protein